MSLFPSGSRRPIKISQQASAASNTQSRPHSWGFLCFREQTLDSGEDTCLFLSHQPLLCQQHLLCLHGPQDHLHPQIQGQSQTQSPDDGVAGQSQTGRQSHFSLPGLRHCSCCRRIPGRPSPAVPPLWE